MAKLRVDKIAAPIVKDEFTGSVYFDGSSDYLSLPVSSDFQFGSGDFTIECWAYALDEGTDDILGIYNTGDDRRTFALRKDQTESVQFLFSSNGSSGTSLSSAESIIQLRTWHHYAVVRRNSVYEIYFDGVKVATKSDSTDAIYTNNDDGLRIGSSYNTDFHGYISNLRVCKGHAVYTGNFTPPTRELEVHTGAKGVVFPAADNRTVLLACQSSTDATAEATGRHTITAAGNATAADANPGLFRKTNITSTITENTGAVFFDGTGDYFDIVENNNDFDFDGDFTVEFWVYFNTVNSRNDTVGSGNNSVYLGSSKSGWIASYYTLSGSKWHFSYQSNQSWIFEYTFSFTSVADTWYHVAFTREGSSIKCFVDGVQQGSTQSSSATLTSSENLLRVGGGGGSTSLLLNGYLSNLRICKGHAVYTSQFIPPTRELEVHPETVLLACYDGENIFADKSGRHIIAAYGDRTSSPTPTATDSPIGSTTVTPGLTREVDPTAGPTFQGGAGFTSQNWLTLPKGTTTDRNRTGGRAIQGAGFNFTPSQTYINSIFYYQISSTGNALDFGDLLNAEGQIGSLGSSTRGIFAGQSNPDVGNVIQFVTIATTGNAVNFGDMTTTKWASGGAANSTRGLFAGGRAPGYRASIDYITIATLGDAADFGDLTATGHEMSAASSPTRAIFAGGSAPGGSISNLIDYVTIATTGNALDFGDLTSTRKVSAGVASQTRMCVGGGLNPGVDQGIEYLTISTLGNAQDFGNLTGSEGRWGLGGTSNSIRGVFGGGYDPSPATALNTMDYITIASTGNANDFGDIGTSTGVAFATGLSDSHGGLS